MGFTINHKECRAAGVDPNEVMKIARRFDSAAADAAQLGVVIFAGSDGSLRFKDHPAKGALVLANMSAGCWDGGDGANAADENGLLRGEDRK